MFLLVLGPNLFQPMVSVSSPETVWGAPRHLWARYSTINHMNPEDFSTLFRVNPDTRVRLRDYDPAWTGKHKSKQDLEDVIQKNLERLEDAQALLWANGQYALLIVLQAMDTAGKDGLIKHVVSGVNPQGCQVSSFKQPTTEELDHDFLWRYSTKLPARGRIGIFNRSYYEEVLVVRVHPEFLVSQNRPYLTPSKELWKQRYEDINSFEEHLARNGTVIVKFFLNLSKGEQKKRLQDRLDNPEKHWKFSAADLAERAHWDEYMKAYEDTLNGTSTAHAPWHVIPADHKWVSRWIVSEILVKTLQDLKQKPPQMSKQQKAAPEDAKKALADG
jgi:PPK2 family polyphosphate:nucleotide phosphotransferase